MNKYPVWKYVVIATAMVVAFLYALPNFYGTVPAVQVAGLRAVKADTTTLKAVEDALKEANLAGGEVRQHMGCGVAQVGQNTQVMGTVGAT